MKGLLQCATRRLLLQAPQVLSMPKQEYTIDDDYISIIDFMEGNYKIQQRDYQHIKELIKDKSVLKRYFSYEIIEIYNHLPFIQLGIEYLIEHSEFEDAQKGKMILEKLMSEICKRKIHRGEINAL